MIFFKKKNELIWYFYCVKNIVLNFMYTRYNKILNWESKFLMQTMMSEEYRFQINDRNWEQQADVNYVFVFSPFFKLMRT